MSMHSIYLRFCVLASLAILSVGASSQPETPSKEANVTMSFRETRAPSRTPQLNLEVQISWCL
jgi:hypothetical protein